VALWAPPAFSSRQPRQPPGNQCDPASYSAAFSPCGGFLCSRCGAINLGSLVCGVLFRPIRPLRSRESIIDHGASRRGRSATRLSDTGRTDAHNASLVPWLTLRHGQGDEFSLLSSFLCRSPSFANRAGCSREIVKSRVESRVLQRLDDGFSLYPTDNVFTNKGLTGSLSLSSSLFLTLSHSL